jgi:hypothetical protein
MSKSAQNISIASHQNNELSSIQKLVNLVLLDFYLLALFNVNFPNKTIWFTVSMSSILIGIIIYARTYLTKPAGISNNGLFHKSLTNRGVFCLYAWHFINFLLRRPILVS